RRRGLPHLYLGYWIEDHPKMRYKSRFQPLQILRDGQWQSMYGGDGEQGIHA
ncbi:MAG: hypothetical protein KDI56_11010, partial [Xanthomonadales bacterium]|nr:hypothetical protein [Xanthomonadales bacterium]